jgi:hypothetical protein
MKYDVSLIISGRDLTKLAIVTMSESGETFCGPENNDVSLIISAGDLTSLRLLPCQSQARRSVDPRTMPEKHLMY